MKTYNAPNLKIANLIFFIKSPRGETKLKLEAASDLYKSEFYSKNKRT